jgi:hypothetical protein
MPIERPTIDIHTTVSDVGNGLGLSMLRRTKHPSGNAIFVLCGVGVVTDFVLREIYGPVTPSLPRTKLGRKMLLPCIYVGAGPGTEPFYDLIRIGEDNPGLDEIFVGPHPAEVHHRILHLSDEDETAITAAFQSGTLNHFLHNYRTMHNAGFEFVFG